MDSPDVPPKVRVACIQYRLGAVGGFGDFARKVESLVGSAAGQGAEFVLLPEFFSLDLLPTCSPSGRDGILHLARDHTGAFIDHLSSLAMQHGIHIIGGSHPVEEDGKLLNKSFIFGPDGEHVAQPKLHITPFESNDWGIVGGDQLLILTTPRARIAVQICYDVEFPAATSCLADEGVDILFVPYCTDDREGMLRVRYCSQARAVEHQIYVATAGLVGALPGIESMSVHVGQSAVHTPSDLGFATDGVAALAEPDVETILLAELDIAALRHARCAGTVTPKMDERRDLFEFRAAAGKLAVIHKP